MKKFQTVTFAVIAVCLLVAGVALADHHESKKMSDPKDIVETAVAAGSFNTLAAALGAADLVTALQGEGPFTVFAPTDAAFAALPAGTVESLLRPENKDQLIAILTYHVVAGELPASAVASSQGADTLNGERLAFRTQDGSVMVGGATVVQADVEASNGVIHVIDTVLIPGS